jgi:DNA-directed RNA polymerase subunit K/omega
MDPVLQAESSLYPLWLHSHFRNGTPVDITLAKVQHMTRFEQARVAAVRAEQLAQGDPVKVACTSTDPVSRALEELEAGVFQPMTLHRILPSGDIVKRPYHEVRQRGQRVRTW